MTGCIQMHYNSRHEKLRHILQYNGLLFQIGYKLRVKYGHENYSDLIGCSMPVKIILQDVFKYISDQQFEHNFKLVFKVY